ncbi:MAG: sigma-54 dependent transcriptional regulator [Desulfobulbaceae bacterium]|nr:sigma-54 dependent transcriptional regulator [Desulfobulbaceae bacterium]
MHDKENSGSGRQIMIVDDDPYLLNAIHQTLTLNGYEADAFVNPVNALEAFDRQQYLAVIADVKMPIMDGLTFLKNVRQLDPDLPVIMITGHGDVDMAVVAMKNGAYDFLEKPVDEDVLLSSLDRSIEKMELVLRNRELNRQLAEARENRVRFQGLIGNHQSMQRLYHSIEIVAREDYPVLITGETGTGKEIVARAVHDLSGRSGRPFVPVNMGAIPIDMLEAELFGYERGAFTGATQTKIGKFEFAGEGSLFLDEISCLPLTLQAKLLRVLENRTMSRLGSNLSIPLHSRIIAATNCNLEQEVERGRFRQDLYFRLNVLPVHVPALRERKSDIPLLFRYFCNEYAREHGLAEEIPDDGNIRQLLDRDWPGNVRELKNFARRYCVYRDTPFHPGEDPDSTPADTDDITDSLCSLKQAVDEAERKHIIAALEKCNGRINVANTLLGISRKCLYDKINKHRIDPDTFRKNKVRL